MFNAAKKALYLCIDQGGHSTRARIYDASLQLISEAQQGLTTSRPHPGWVEHNASELINALQTCIHDAVSKLGSRKSDLVAAGIACQRANIACWDRINGKPLANIISWQDSRNHRWIETFQNQTDHINEITGLYPNGHYGVSKLHWCMEHLIEVKSAYQDDRLYWGPMASFIAYQLLDEKPYLTDYINASRTLLFNLQQHQWSNSLLESFDLQAPPLPATQANASHFGTLSIDDINCPLMLLTGDQSASLFSEGPPETDCLYVTIGTGAFVQHITGNKRLSTKGLLSSMIHSTHEDCYYAIEATINGAASALDWYQAQTTISDLEDKLPQWLSQTSHPPLFLNGVSGLASPYWQTEFPSQFIGNGSIPENFVAIIESIVFLIYLNHLKMNEQCAKPKKILMGGGLSQLDGLCQKLADIMDIPAYRNTDVETSAKGLAVLLGAKAPKQPTQTVFNPKANPDLMRRYQTWHHAMNTTVENLVNQ